MMSICHHYVSGKSILLAGLESILFTAALLCGVQIRFWRDPEAVHAYMQNPAFIFQVLAVVLTFQICFYYGDLYNVSALRPPSRQLVSLGNSLGIGCLILGVSYFVFPNLLIGRGVFFISLFFAGTFVLLTRMAVDKAWPVAASGQKIAILGTGGLAQTVASVIAARGDLGLRLVGFIAAGTEPSRNGNGLEKPALGVVDELEPIIEQCGISRLVIAVEDRRGMLPVNSLVRLRTRGIRIEDAHTAVSSLTGRVWLELVQPSWFIFSNGFSRSPFLLFLKRVADVCFAGVGLAVGWPLMLLIALAIRLDSRGPAIFRQTRVGLNGRHFEVLKFRSMYADAEAHTGARWAAEDDPRVTRVGWILRKFRLDEMPQFVNILRGDMSFVGPRPERPVFVDQLRSQVPYYDQRHSVRPGLTGWAQVEYSYGASVEDAIRKLEYELFYLKNMSAFFDLVIVLKTIRVVLRGRYGR
ncbi:MAG TPA: TIGR03013 family XrtA/PEP-CTERM system glycosyltransferase [Bryobacteraceae bacterium]|nr:TIGR03013 family XrtA/PEP-CTERM system glycosyltransferase [Bryobacteraceae bacterium]